MLRISIIVPCYNGQQNLLACLTAIKKSSFKDYELIVVDDHSSDDTALIANSLADIVIKLDRNKGSGYARKRGIEQASGEIVVFIDSDILIKPDTLDIIVHFLNQNPAIDAVTGLLSKEHPHKDFFSQYKNLYMNYTFNLLPQEVTFLFGSIYAVRRKIPHSSADDLPYTPDTFLGQKLFLKGKRIVFLKELEVIHLKKYTAWALIKNDFVVPFSWTKIFIRFKGWQQLGRNKTGFAHAPKEQLASVILAAVIALLFAATVFIPALFFSQFALLLIWFCLNLKFFAFLLKERGPLFTIAGVLTTFLDHVIMALGIITGLIVSWANLVIPAKSGIFDNVN